MSKMILNMVKKTANFWLHVYRKKNIYIFFITKLS